MRRENVKKVFVGVELQGFGTEDSSGREEAENGGGHAGKTHDLLQNA